MTAVETQAPSAVSRLLGRGIAYSGATAIQGSIAVVTLPAVTRSIGDPGEYGTLAAALVVLQLVTTFAAVGFPAALTREYFDSDNGRGAAGRLIGTSAIAAIVTTIVVHLTGPWWSGAFATLDYRGALPLAVAAVAPSAVLAAGQALLRCEDKPVPFVAATVVGTAGAQLLGLAALWTGERTAERFFSGFLVGVIAGAAIAVIAVGTENLRPASRKLTVSAFKLGAPMLPHAVALYLVMAADRVVVERHLGLAEAGSYQFTYLLGMVGVSLLVAVNNAWVPMVYEEAEEKARWATLASTTEALLRLAVPIVGGLAVGAPLLLRIAAPASFDPVALNPVLVLASLTLLPYVVYLASAMVVFYERRTLFLAITTPSVAVFNLVANEIAVPRWGSTGAASVSLLSYTLLACLVWLTARRFAVVPWSGASLARLVAAAVAFAALAIVAPVDGPWLVVRALLVLVAIATFVQGVRKGLRG